MTSIEALEDGVRQDAHDSLTRALLDMRVNASKARTAIQAGARLNAFSLTDIGWIEHDLRRALKVIEEVKGTWE